MEAQTSHTLLPLRPFARPGDQMNQTEARIETLKALVRVSYNPSVPMTERQAAWSRFKAICGYYRIDPGNFHPMHLHIPAPPRQFTATKPPLRPITQSLIYPQQKKLKIMKDASNRTESDTGTSHSGCTHPPTKVARAKCRRHRKKLILRQTGITTLDSV